MNVLVKSTLIGILFANFNDTLTSLFPEELKYADIKTLEVIKEITDHIVFSLTFLKYMKDFYTKKLETNFESILSHYQSGFRKGFCVLTTLLPMIEKWRESLD